MAESEEKEFCKIISVHVKSPKTKHKECFQVDVDIDILEFKKLVAEKYDVEPYQISLIFAGKIMKDTDTLKTHNVKDGFTVHMVVKPIVPEGESSPTDTAPGSNAPISPLGALGGLPNVTNTGGLGLGNLGGLGNMAGLGNMGGLGLLGQMGFGSSDLSAFENLAMGRSGDLGTQLHNDVMQNPEMLRQMMDNPLVQGIMSDPENMRMMVTSNPQIRELIERNPEINHMLQNPELLRQTMELARNPAMLQELMRSHDRAISNLESIPGGYNALQRMYRDIQEPMLNAASEQFGRNPFSGLIVNPANGVTPNPQQGTENRDPLPNPWSPNGSNASTPRAGTTPVSSEPNVTPRSPLGADSPLMAGFMQQMRENPQVLQHLMTSPAVRQMMTTFASDPNLMGRTAQDNPFLNPNVSMDRIEAMSRSLATQMQNPEMMRLLTSPEMMNDLMQLSQSMQALNIGNTPTPISPTTLNPNTNGGTPTNGGPTMGSFSDMMQMVIQGMPMGGIPGMPGMPGNQAPPPEQRYRTQLDQLQAMGFCNQEANIQALVASFGDITAAVERLLAQNLSRS